MVDAERADDIARNRAEPGQRAGVKIADGDQRSARAQRRQQPFRNADLAAAPGRAPVSMEATGPIIRIRFSLPASLWYPPTLCDAAWRITPADAERAGCCAKLRLFIKDDLAQGEGINGALGLVPSSSSEHPPS